MNDPVSIRDELTVSRINARAHKARADKAEAALRAVRALVVEWETTGAPSVYPARLRQELSTPTDSHSGQRGPNDHNERHLNDAREQV